MPERVRRPRVSLKASARSRLGGSVHAVARRLPPPRDEAFLSLVFATRNLITGRRPRYGLVPGPQLPKVEPLPADMTWRTPPAVDDAATMVRSIYDTGATADRYDVELLEKLNAEYADKPIVPAPLKYDPASLEERAHSRLGWVHNTVDLRNKTVLEIGCGNGFEVWSMAYDLGCDAYGVDVREYGPWDTLSGDRVHFACADIANEHPFPPNKFDVVVSFVVWEHVLHPYAMLKETFDILKPGGLAWIRANLYAGPMASHRYRHINFPWPHLLFHDDVISEWDERHGHNKRGAEWVNRLSWLHYERYIQDIGFRLRHLSFTGMPFDEEFYTRFEDVLGRFPKTDLSRDFFLAVLEKPA